MKEFGVLILFWPLVYVALAVFIIVKITRKYSGKKKVGMILLFAFLFYLPLGWDVILGRSYFYYLCKTQAGVHVYEQVAIDPKYFAPDADPNYFDPDADNYFFTGGRSLREPFNIENRYSIKYWDDRYFSKKFNISKSYYSVYDKKKQKHIAEDVAFTYFGGWFANKGQPFDVGGTRCPSLETRPKTADFLKEVFIPLQ